MSRGPHAPLVAVLDFPGLEQRARLSETFAGAGLDLRELMTRPLPSLFAAEEYAGSLLGRLEADRPVTAVLASCMASPLAHEAMRRLCAATESTASPLLVVFDGSPCSAEFVAGTYREISARFGVGEFGPIVDCTAEDLIERPAEVLEVMETTLRAAVRVQLETEGVESEFADALCADLVGRAVEWLAQLVAAHNCRFQRLASEVVLIASNEHTFVQEWPGASVTTIIEFDCKRAELLTRPDVRDVVVHLIDAAQRRLPLSQEPCG